VEEREKGEGNRSDLQEPVFTGRARGRTECTVELSKSNEQRNSDTQVCILLLV